MQARHAVGSRAYPAERSRDLTNICAGKVHMAGRHVNGAGAARVARLGVAFVPEGRAVFPNLTVAANLSGERKEAVVPRGRVLISADRSRDGERLGPRTVSRLVEICGDLLPLFGDDRRREFRAQRTGTAQQAG